MDTCIASRCVSETDVESAQSALGHASAEGVLDWALARFGDRVVLACSFGAEDVVLVDMLARSRYRIPIFVLDTGRLPEETYNVMDRCRERYGIEFEVYVAQTSALQTLLRAKGPNSFYRSVEERKGCCEIRKVEPLRRALAGREAWITGLRKEQSVTRQGLAKVERDDAHGGIFKLNPLADWTEDQIWSYIRAHDVPYNALHDQGFPSIGCAPCTRAVQPGEDIRAGRWWWESPEHKECGLHLRLSPASGNAPSPEPA